MLWIKERNKPSSSGFQDCAMNRYWAQTRLAAWAVFQRTRGACSGRAGASSSSAASSHKAGVDAFLIGEYFMRQNDIGAALREIKLGASGKI